MASEQHSTSRSEGSVTNDNSGTSPEQPRLTLPTVHTDPRVDLLISTLRPIDPDTASDEPRIPIRTELLRQLNHLVREADGFEMEDWITAEFNDMEQRDRLWQAIQDSMQMLEAADRLAERSFRSTLAM
jgi:hypothetical protein